ncbi:MAG: M1 family peptidase [Bacteroidetes bacterium]|nr:MAG: M1 family peptidase [Bacteroidota bacterium]TAF93977.1 MAG: M1 family peptidase [Bacteroidota bacterium]
MKQLLLVAALASSATLLAQHNTKLRDDSWKKHYRATPEKINNLVHTKIEASFDYDKQYLNGKVWLTITPQFDAVDSLLLDAKGMNIHQVNLVAGTVTKPLNYSYDSSVIRIKLNKTYTRTEKYTVYVAYTAKPNELKVQGSSAITDAKGLYFINPKGEEKDKPTQVWTQGETEATSVWCPTIDRPNQKTTQETILTVPAKYVTLSNGVLVSSKPNKDGSRTDTWKMDLPHAPYLFFMGVGDYAVIKDSYKGKEVSYYVEKDYANVARKIFGETPAMMAYFSKLTGVEYPWSKYSQMTARDYVSGAMENTTATLHSDAAQQNARQLVDANDWEDVVSHELFHHWFGDLVTAESWSNLTVNESFANYSELLWREFKYGKENAHLKNHEDMQGYLGSRSEAKDLVRFYYKDKEDMFDAVSYNKGGRILHMLRNYVGDSAFFASINNYLTTNKFKAGEAHHVRLAFEEVTGKDLNWFFNQWYFGAGNPKLNFTYGYNAAAKMATISVKQTQTGDKVFQLPLAVDVYVNGTKTRHNVWVTSKTDSFSFPAATEPNAIYADADRILLAEIVENLTPAQQAFMYKNGNALARLNAVEAAAELENGAEILAAAITDKNNTIRRTALQTLAGSPLTEAVENTVVKIANTDVDRRVRASAIKVLKETGKKQYQALYEKAVLDSSYAVAGAALLALAEVDEKKALELLPTLKKDAKGALNQATQRLDILTKTDADFDEVFNGFTKASLQDKFQNAPVFISYLNNITTTANFKKAVDAATAFNKMAGNFSPEYADAMKKEMRKIIGKKEAAAQNSANKDALLEQAAYLTEKLK